MGYRHIKRSLDRKDNGKSQNSHVLHQAEQIILQAANHHQKVCVLRLGGIYGPDRELVSMFGGMAGIQ